jgi:DNA-directed RNA polymerase specialized sigma24 family protein
MPNFDGTVDNRWRPDLESSQRRVREEERAAVVYSRELSFVPTRHKSFEPDDAQTKALIRRVVELERLRHGERIGQLLEEWRWIDKMKDPCEKQRFLEPRIEAVRRDPARNEHLVIFLMLAFEPVRRSVSKAFVDAHSGLTPQPRDMAWSNRAEAQMIRHIERESLYDVTREAALEAVYRYPMPPPERFFLWLRETIAHRALDKLRGELPEAETAGAIGVEAAAMQAALAGFEQVDAPPLREARGFRAWRDRIHMRDVFDVVEKFFSHDPVRDACRAAVGRLPRAERAVINGFFYEELSVPQPAERRAVATSTIDNQKAKAQSTLRRDDVFFSALYALSRVRDEARAKRLATRYPDGRLPDGCRRIVIQHAA